VFEIVWFIIFLKVDYWRLRADQNEVFEAGHIEGILKSDIIFQYSSAFRPLSYPLYVQTETKYSTFLASHSVSHKPIFEKVAGRGILRQYLV
jgi:hypothetical protein